MKFLTPIILKVYEQIYRLIFIIVEMINTAQVKTTKRPLLLMVFSVLNMGNHAQ